jgi:hypothetical protein
VVVACVDALEVVVVVVVTTGKSKAEFTLIAVLSRVRLELDKDEEVVVKSVVVDVEETAAVPELDVSRGVDAAASVQELVDKLDVSRGVDAAASVEELVDKLDDSLDDITAISGAIGSPVGMPPAV